MAQREPCSSCSGDCEGTKGRVGERLKNFALLSKPDCKADVDAQTGRVLHRAVSCSHGAAAVDAGVSVWIPPRVSWRPLQQLGQPGARCWEPAACSFRDAIELDTVLWMG